MNFFLFFILEMIKELKIFRVDNPHTKPIPFLQWLIAELSKRCRCYFSVRSVHKT